MFLLWNFCWSYFLGGELCFSSWFIRVVYILLILLLQVGTLLFYLFWLSFNEYNFIFTTNAICILFETLLCLWSHKRHLPMCLNFNFWHLCPLFTRSWVFGTLCEVGVQFYHFPYGSPFFLTSFIYWTFIVFPYLIWHATSSVYQSCIPMCVCFLDCTLFRWPICLCANTMLP